MKNPLLLGAFVLLSLFARAQYLTNINYHLKFGDLDPDGFPGKTIVEGDYVYTVSHKYVANEGTNILVKKHHVDGTETWEVTHANAGTTYDYGVDIAVNSIGDVFVLGAKQNGTGGDYEYQLIKYNGNSGGQIWTYTYNNGGQDDVLTNFVLDGSSNAYITGIKDQKSGSEDVLTVCVNSGGIQSWVATYDYDSHPDGGFMVEVDGLNLYCFAITTGDGAQKELTKIKYDLITGNQLSVDRTSLNGDFDLKDIKKNSSGAYIACGSKINVNGDKDLVVYSFSSNLGINWSYTADEDGGDDIAHKLVTDASNNTYVLAAENLGENYQSLAVFKLSGTGILTWEYEFAPQEFTVLPKSFF